MAIKIFVVQFCTNVGFCMCRMPKCTMKESTYTGALGDDYDGHDLSALLSFSS